MVSNAVVEGVAGAVGGIAALLTTYPLMTISTLQATRRRKVSEGDEEEQLVVPVKRQTSTIADFAQVISTSGYTGLYQGIEPALLGTAVSQGVYFYLYSKLREAAQRILERSGRAESGDIGVGPSLLVAFLAGCGNVLLTNPIWVVSTRMQAHQKGGTGSDEEKLAHRPLAVGREIVRESGILGLWKGVLPSLVMVSNPTVNYVLYEWLLARLAELRQRRAKDKRLAPASGATALEIFLVSALAKLGATIVTYPLLLIKQRLQSAGKHTHADRKYTSTADAVRRIWQNEGLLGFYAGMNTKIVQSILAAALMMAIKEKITAGTRAVLETPNASPSVLQEQAKTLVTGVK